MLFGTLHEVRTVKQPNIQTTLPHEFEDSGRMKTTLISEILQLRTNGRIEQALELAVGGLKTTEAEVDRAMLMREAGLCLRSLGRYNEALDWYDRALNEIRGHDEYDLNARLQVNRGVALFRLMRYNEAEVAFREAETHKQFVKPETMLMLYTSRAKLHRNRGQSVEALEQSLLARAIAELVADPAQRGKSMVETSVSYAALGAFDDALNEAYAAVENLEGSSELGALSDAYTQVYILLHNVNNHADALEYARRAFDAACRAGSDLSQILCACNVALALTDNHHDDRGLRFLEENANIPNGMHSPIAEIRRLGVMGQVLCELLRFAEAQHALTNAITMAESAGAWRESVSMRFTRAQAYLGAGMETLAMKDLRSLLQELDTNPPREAGLLVHVLTFAWRTEEQRKRYREAVMYANRAWEAQKKLHTDSTHKLAKALHVKLNVAKRDTELREMQERALNAEHRLEQSRKELAAAALRQVESMRNQASSGSRRQQNVFSEADWLLFERQFDETYSNFIAGLLLKCPDLSRAEQRVCTLLVLRMTSKDIAALLSCSLRTVEWHRLRIRKKLNCAAKDDLGAVLCAMATQITLPKVGS